MAGHWTVEVTRRAVDACTFPNESDEIHKTSFGSATLFRRGVLNEKNNRFNKAQIMASCLDCDRGAICVPFSAGPQKGEKLTTLSFSQGPAAMFGQAGLQLQSGFNK